jgi:hypothetical protein
MTHEVTAAPVVQVFSSTEYDRQEQSKKQEKVSQVRSFVSRSRKGLTEGNVKDANWEFNTALRLNEGLADEQTKRELEGLKRDLGKVQGSNLIRAQRAYAADNAFRYNVQTAPQQSEAGGAQQQGQQAAALVQYDDDVAEQQALALSKAQEVSVAKVQPLRANLPTRGQRHRFTQVLQTEVNKPMTVAFTAKSTKEVGGFTRISYATGGFVGLWILVTIVTSRRSRAASAPA